VAETSPWARFGGGIAIALGLSSRIATMYSEKSRITTLGSDLPPARQVRL
jgi:hypothetical protein